jgi:hypothetical protein
MAANTSKDATAESTPPSSREATKPDLMTIAAIAIVGQGAQLRFFANKDQIANG